MKILQINVTVNSGSTGRIAEQLGDIINEKNFESFIAYARKGNHSKSKTIKVGNNFSFYWHVLISRLFDKHGFASKKATKNLIGEIEKISPDLIHLHNLHGYYVHVGELFEFLNGLDKPVVWTFHDCWPITGHCAYFDRVQCEKWKTACYACPLTTYYPASFGFDNSKNNFKNKKKLFSSHHNLTIVTPSKWLLRLVEQSFFKKNDVKVIHNGIDLSIFKPTISSLRTKFNLKESKIILGVANIWDDRKGFFDFLKLSKLLDKNFQIILIGLSKKQLKMLPANVIGIERTENVDELVKWYSVADVYLNPTYSDNFPTTNIEAIACGTPVITYDTGGSPEAIDGNTGLVVEKGNFKGLLDGITFILENKERFALQKCRNRAVASFNKDERFHEYMTLYKELIPINE